VHWEGYSSEEDSWEPERNVRSEKTREFWVHVKNFKCSNPRRKAPLPERTPAVPVMLPYAPIPQQIVVPPPVVPQHTPVHKKYKRKSPNTSFESDTSPKDEEESEYERKRSEQIFKNEEYAKQLGILEVIY
jgi:hypothetical protein